MVALALFILILIFSMFLFTIRKLFIQQIVPKVFSGHFLLVIAHPDDEIMFFWPLISSKVVKIDIICLSNGNFYHKGDLREKEFSKICEYLQITGKIENKFIDNNNWYFVDIFRFLKNKYRLSNYDGIISFDGLGISYHQNHVSCFKASYLLAKYLKIDFYELATPGLIRKYFWVQNIKNDDFVFVGCKGLGVNVFKKFYGSQMEWFRYFYLTFSILMSVNVLCKNKKYKIFENNPLKKINGVWC